MCATGAAGQASGCRVGRPERGAKRGWHIAGLDAQRAIEVTLIGEAQLGGETGQVSLAIGELLERGARAEANAVARDGVTGRGAEDPAEVVRRDGERSRQLGQRALWVGGENLTSTVDNAAAGADRRRSAGGDGPWVDLLECSRDERDRPFGKLVRVAPATDGCEQQPMLEVELRRGWELAAREDVVAPDRCGERRGEGDGRAVIATGVGVIEALVLAGICAIRGHGVQ